MNRRNLMWLAGAALLPSASEAKRKAKQFQMPGAHLGRVVEVRHPASIINDKPDRRVVAEMLRRGIMELTGAPDAVQGWRSLFERGDVVGVKVNPVGMPLAPTTH